MQDTICAHSEYAYFVVMNVTFNDVICIPQGPADVDSFARPSLSLFDVGGGGPRDYLPMAYNIEILLTF